MSRPGQIRFLSRVAPLYEPVVTLMRFRSLWRAVAAAAAPERGERVLDVCTGTGGLARELERCGARPVAVDLAAGMLRRVRLARTSDASPPLARMDARALAFPDRTFPLVTCCMALHEMSELERAQVLAELARVASDRVVVADYRVPDSRLARALFRLRLAFEYLESDAFEPFVRRGLRERLSAAGLAPLRHHDVHGYRIWVCTLRPRASAGAAEPDQLQTMSAGSRSR